MKHHMHKTLCASLGLNPSSKLNCKAIFEDDFLSALIVDDGSKTYTLYYGTAPYAIAKSIFNVNDRIRSTSFKYSLPPLLQVA